MHGRLCVCVPSSTKVSCACAQGAAARDTVMRLRPAISRRLRTTFLGLLALGGPSCEAVFGGLAVPAVENCVINSSACTKEQICNAITQLCQDSLVLSQATPAHGRTTAQTPVTISGENFVPGMTVKWNGVALQPVTVDSPTQLRVVAPISSDGGWRVDIAVTNPSGLTVSRNDLFSYSANDVTFSVTVPTDPNLTALFSLCAVPAVGRGRGAVYIPETSSRLRSFTFNDDASEVMELGRLTAPPNVVMMFPADFNGDGIRDLLLTSSSGYFWLQGNPDSSFQQYTPIRLDTVLARGMALGDLDHDGRADVVGTDPGGTQLAIMRDRGSKYATFATLGMLEIRSIVMAELDGQPGDDIAFSYVGAVDHFGLVQGGSTLMSYPEVNITSCASGELQAARFGATTQSLVLTCPDRVQVLQASGGGKFTAGLNWPVNAATQKLAGGRPLPADFDNDGDLDMLVVRAAATVAELWLLENIDGQGNLVPRQLMGNLTVPQNTVVDVGDMNDDGKPDVIIADRTTASQTPLTVLLNRSR